MRVKMKFEKSACLIILNLFALLLGDELPGNLTDLNICRVSHLGTEYAGDVAKTESGVRCQFWQTEQPVHRVDETLKDENFVDGTRKAAKNYCRNPTKEPRGPWCYTMAQDLRDETCGIPLCIFTECRITGNGMEYGGQHAKARSDRSCLKWNKDRDNVRFHGGKRSQPKFDDIFFPDETTKDAKKNCRNPDGDLGGPWCFVEMEELEEVEKEYCDVPFCDDEDCMFFSRNISVYSHYTSFDRTLTNISFGIKLWEPDAYMESYAKLALTLLALPINGQQMESLGIGIELYLSNKGSALTTGNKKLHLEPSNGIMKSTQYTFFSLTWESGIITLNKEGTTKPIFLEEYKIKDNLLGFHKNKFMYYSAQGTNVMWSFPFCDDNDDCDVHTTTTDVFQQFWPLRDAVIGFDLKFYILGANSANLLLVPSPAVDYPQVRIVFLTKDNMTRVVVTEYPKSPTKILGELQIIDIIKLWKWHEFSLSLFSDTLLIHWTKESGTHAIFELKHRAFHQLRWFSPSSDDNLVKWTFNCMPHKSQTPPSAWPPECALNADETDYKGTQSVTHQGLPCLPWAGKELVPDLGEKFSGNTSIMEAFNYCRDVGNELKGTFCYVVSQSGEHKVEKQFCKLRKCKSAECKMAGTGNDYIGHLSTTRSNRTCQQWVKRSLNPSETTENLDLSFDLRKKRVETEPSNPKDSDFVSLIHQVDPKYLNETLFADSTVEDAANFCRNPSRNVAGSWCYTTDEKVQMDICNVRDCDMPEECVIITRGSTESEGSLVYILPQWKERGNHGGLRFSVKRWDPDQPDGIIFLIRPKEGEESLRLTVGAHNEEKILLQLNGELIKEKTMPHLIPSGRWAAFWLQIRQGELLFGFEGVPTALFEWKHENASAAFNPMFLSYMSIRGSPLGLFFKCDECHMENTTMKHLTRIMPTGVWKVDELPVHNNFTLTLRGVGIAFIPLMLLPGSKNYYAVTLDNHLNVVTFIEKGDNEEKILTTGKHNGSLFTRDSWTKFAIHFSEKAITIKRESSIILRYNSTKPMLMYWFSVGVETGWVTWTANCEPLDIDGPPRDGGWSVWSPWQCTVSCGGGEGFRTRTCSNPHPNIFGLLCHGSPISTGKCNDFKCGDVSPATMNLIRQRLQQHQFGLVINEGDSVVLNNDEEMLKKIEQESPEANFEWSRNGIYIKPEEEHIGVQKGDVHIWKARHSDTGSYVCMVYRINGERLVLKIITVAVKSKQYDVVSRATLPTTLVSNAVVLGYIYSELSQKWLINDKVYKDYGITTLAAVSAEAVQSLNHSHSGDWQCLVEQKDLKLRWVTNYVKVQVKSQPTIYTHLMEDELTAPFFGWMETETNIRIALVAIVVFVVVLVVVFLKLYLKYGRLPTRKNKKKYKRNRRNES